MIKGARNARRPWEPDEDKQLREMVEAGKSVTLMALRHRRTKRLFDSAYIFSTFIFAITGQTRRVEAAVHRPDRSACSPPQMPQVGRASDPP
jgi:reverse gyrase